MPNQVKASFAAPKALVSLELPSVNVFTALCPICSETPHPRSSQRRVPPSTSWQEPCKPHTNSRSFDLGHNHTLSLQGTGKPAKHTDHSESAAEFRGGAREKTFQRSFSSLGTLKSILLRARFPVYSAGSRYQPVEIQGPLSVSEGGRVGAWTASRIASAVQSLPSIRRPDRRARNYRRNKP